MLKNVLMVGIGSFLGGVSRYWVSKLIDNGSIHSFPWGTLTVNLLGCFLIGFIIGLSNKENPMETNWRLFLTTGFCGGFTTFSAFSLESINMLRNGHLYYTLIYITLSITFGILLTYLGFVISKLIR